MRLCSGVIYLAPSPAPSRICASSLMVVYALRWTTKKLAVSYEAFFFGGMMARLVLVKILRWLMLTRMMSSGIVYKAKDVSPHIRRQSPVPTTNRSQGALSSFEAFRDFPWWSFPNNQRLSSSRFWIRRLPSSELPTGS
jgi:hypothetical protein